MHAPRSPTLRVVRNRLLHFVIFLKSLTNGTGFRPTQDEANDDIRSDLCARFQQGTGA
jgi:hypothetical protein